MRSLTRVGICEPPSATTVFLRAPSVFFNPIFKRGMTEISNLMATAPKPPPRPVFKEPRPVNPNSLPFFNRIVEDLIVNIFGRLEEDPRDLARLACVCPRFRNLIKSSCYKRQCMRVVPCIVSELMQSNSQQDVLAEPPGGWEALQKVLVCCPGLSHAGALLNCWDYGLEREIGRSDDFAIVRKDDLPKSRMEAKDVSETGAVNTSDLNIKDKSSEPLETQSENSSVTKPEVSSRTYPHREHTTIEHYQCGINGKRRFNSACTSQLFDDANGDARTSSSGKKELLMGGDGPIKLLKTDDLHYHGKVMKERKFIMSYRRLEREEERGAGSQSPRIRSLERRGSKERSGNSGGGRRSIQTERRINHEEEPHLAKGVWTLTREQGNKLLASRFRSDSLFICDWPGCMHQGERRTYKLFRGIFKNFQQSHVFRNLKDLRAKKTEIRCAFCSEKTYDMVTTFCLRRSFEYHDDGEPVIRAYVCDDGHVGGAWTDRPLYNL